MWTTPRLRGRKKFSAGRRGQQQVGFDAFSELMKGLEPWLQAASQSA
jgi:hypothetical protein